jgi:hypothetical protein
MPIRRPADDRVRSDMIGEGPRDAVALRDLPAGGERRHLARQN